MRRVLSLFVAVLCLTALVGPAAAAATPVASPGSSGEVTADRTATQSGGSTVEMRPSGSPAVTAQVSETCEASSNETIGYWGGVCHDTALDIDTTDGLSEAELTTIVHRGMARVEHIRNRSFNESVPVETMTRAEYAATFTENDSAGTNSSTADAQREFNRWNDQVWKALFIVGDDGSSEDAIEGTLSGSVAGFYSPAEDRIVIVVPEGETVQINEATLVHELTHAMQDQYHNLSNPQYAGSTQDTDLAIDGIVEGEASYVENRYRDRCQTDEWQCLETPRDDGGGGGAPENWGIYLTVFQPYSDGPAYVAEIVEEEGWSGVADRMEDPPTTTAETIHREPRRPVNISFNDTARNGWKTYPDQGVNGSDTVGEASMFTMFWYQNRMYDAETFDWRSTLSETTHPESVYNYDHPTTAGWAGDRLFPYRNDAGTPNGDGYVWITEWRSATDARQFQTTYRQVLAAHDAVHRADGTRYIADGGFSGAYAVERNGTRVTIVHAPTPDDVFDLRPDIDPEEPVGDTETGGSGIPPVIPTDGSVDETGTPGGSETTAEQTPGFGINITLVAIAAVIVATLLGKRRR